MNTGSSSASGGWKPNNARARFLLSMAGAMAVERRARDRRTMPSQHLDVTRLEHENLCRQVDEVLRLLRRIETELHAQGDRIAALENGSAKRNENG